MSTNKTNIIDVIKEPFARFFKIEASGGIVLIIFTIFALILANSGLSDFYTHFWEKKLTIGFSSWALSKDLHHWINDGLMVIFFFVVGLEIKREMLTGELSSIKKASLPILAAIGGMILPATFYILLNKNPETASGWGIPMATDIAFSLGVLSLLGKRVPLALKVFLVAFAIVDDLGAVLVIAIFYSHDLYVNFLLYGLGLYLILVIFNLINIRSVTIFMIIGWVIWYFFLKSGIHPTIAGVLIAFSIPTNRNIRLKAFKDNMDSNMNEFCAFSDKTKQTLTHHQLAAVDNMTNLISKVQSPLQNLEHNLHGFVTYVVMPVFALANAGVSFANSSFGDVFSSLSFNIEFSLIVGKVLGILIFSWIAVKLKLADLPDNVKWIHITGMGLLGGMGFTMSLFISNLAFSSLEFLNMAKIGILAGSFIAGVAGFIILKFTLKESDEKR